MTIAELIERLQQLDEDQLVFIDEYDVAVEDYSQELVLLRPLFEHCG